MAKQQPGSSVSRYPDGFRILQGKQEFVTYVDYSSIRIWASEIETHYDTHVHSAIEIIMPHSGCSTYALSDKTYNVHAGEILIIPTGCAHELTEESGIFRHLFLFEPNPLLSLRDIPMISEMMKEPLYLTGDTPLQKQVKDILLEVIDLYNRRELMWNSQCYACLLRMYALLGQNYLENASPAEQTFVKKIESPVMNSAITYINEHYMENITMDEVAAFAGFSKYYFSRTFRQFTGYSFPDFLARKRLNIAADLLIRTDDSIQSISETSGFFSVPTFNRVFRKHKNCTPTQFRAIYGHVQVSDPTEADNPAT